LKPPEKEAAFWVTGNQDDHEREFPSDEKKPERRGGWIALGHRVGLETTGNRSRVLTF